MKSFSHKRPVSPWLTFGLLVVVTVVYSGFSLALAGQGENALGSHPLIFLLNTLPVFLCLLLLWLATGQAWIASLVTGAVLFLLTGGNYFKILFRDDPLLWDDLRRIREGLKMSGQYEVSLTPLMILWIVVIVAVTVLLFFLGKGRPKLPVRLVSLGAAAVVLVVCFWKVFPNDLLYTRMAGETSKNQTQAYMTCGVVYPFLHSMEGNTEGYDEVAGKAIMDRYQDADIPQDKKVSIISMQMEAFADFSQYNIDGLSPEVYRDFHDLQEQSYSGTLVTDIFAGGTAETEWAVITGGNKHGDFLEKTDSVAWYLRDQGYVANGSHPCRDWFYDRKHANPNLGLEDYLFTDNYYNRYTQDDVVYDNVYFPDLEERLTEYFDTNDAPLFSFNVTYQGHGPYETEFTYWGNSYCTGDYPTEVDNALNNYFYSIQDTSHYLKEFTQYLNSREEPVVLVLFGDHKPWMGNQGAYYETLGINLDTSTEEGFRNYYETWYMIWANDSAKETLGNDFQGQSPDLSPCFLMNEVFGLCGWEGSAYMQAQREVAQALPVLHTTGWVMENGALTQTPSAAAQALMDQFQNVSAYDRNRYS